MKKILLPLLALVLVLSMVSCAAPAEQVNAGNGAKKPATPFKHEYVTYTDVIGNLSFDYPANWETKEASVTVIANKETHTGNNISIEFEAYDKENDPYKAMTKDSFSSLFLEDYKANGIEISNISAEPFKNENNVSGTKVSFYAKSETSPDLTQTVYFVLAGDFYYFITLTEVEADDELNDTIMKSLKILAETEPTETEPTETEPTETEPAETEQE
ncbi:MAG: hypothetical protein IJW79_06320 [Clostridia bacterium]|nr:hypothetical protein [Clostridia bacterium]